MPTQSQSAARFLRRADAAQYLQTNLACVARRRPWRSSPWWAAGRNIDWPAGLLSTSLPILTIMRCRRSARRGFPPLSTNENPSGTIWLAIPCQRSPSSCRRPLTVAVSAAMAALMSAFRVATRLSARRPSSPCSTSVACYFFGEWIPLDSGLQGECRRTRGGHDEGADRRRCPVRRHG